MGLIDRRVKLLVLGQEPFLGLEIGFLALLEPGLADLIDRVPEELELPRPLLLGGKGGLEGPALGREPGEAEAEGFHLGLDTGIAIKEPPMVFGCHEGLVLVLAMEVDKEARELGEVGPEAGLVLYEHGASAVGLDATAHEDPCRPPPRCPSPRARTGPRGSSRRR